MEFKEELELLLNNFIITKEKNREEYYKIKSKIKKIREFTTNKLGCDVIVTSSLIKLEKIPSLIDNTFNIEEFDNKKHYILFVLVIMFLEDKAKDEQFILSNLTSFITTTSSSILEEINFNDFSTRKCLIDVLKYMIKIGSIKQIDGNDLLFKDSVENEVLYENTGISHYIIRQFKENIFSYKQPQDFLETVDTEELLNKKRYYTYRTLLFYPIFHYKDFDNEIYNYFINYRNRVSSDLKELLDGDLLIYNNMAILTTIEKQNRNQFPNSRKMIHDIILLVNDYLTKEKEVLTKFEFEQILKKVHSDNNKYFSKEFREMKENKFLEIVSESMEKFGFLKIKDDNYYISPIVYLISGNYPGNEENENYEQLSLGVDF